MGSVICATHPAPSSEILPPPPPPHRSSVLGIAAAAVSVSLAMVRRAWLPLLALVLVLGVFGTPCHNGWDFGSVETETRPPAPPAPPSEAATDDPVEEPAVEPESVGPLGGAGPAVRSASVPPPRNTSSHNNIIVVPVWGCPEGQSRDRRGKCRVKW